MNESVCAYCGLGISNVDPDLKKSAFCCPGCFLLERWILLCIGIILGIVGWIGVLPFNGSLFSLLIFTALLSWACLSTRPKRNGYPELFIVVFALAAYLILIWMQNAEASSGSIAGILFSTEVLKLNPAIVSLSVAPVILVALLICEALIKRAAVQRVREHDDGTGAILAAFRSDPPITANTVNSALLFCIPMAVLVAAAVGYSFYRAHGFETAFIRLAAMLFAMSPALLRLVMPVSTMYAFTTAWKEGFRIKNGRCLEELPLAEIMLFDQAAILDEENVSVLEIHPLPKVESEELLVVAASLMAESDAPVSRALRKELEARGGEIKKLVDGSQAKRTGSNWTGAVQVSLRQSRDAMLGDLDWLEQQGVKFPKDYEPEWDEEYAGPVVDLGVAADERLLGCIRVKSRVREDERESVLALQKKRSGKRRVAHLLSSLPSEAARAVMRSIGASDVTGSLGASEKRAVVERYQNDLKPVCLVADPSSDSEALSEAHVSVAIPPRGEMDESEIKEMSWDASLPERSLKSLPRLIEIAGAARKCLSFGLGWVFAYHIAAIYFTVTGQFSIIAAASLALTVTVVSAIVPPRILS